MGVDVQVYRSRIGMFGSRIGMCGGRRGPKCQYWCVQSIMLKLFRCCIMIILTTFRDTMQELVKNVNLKIQKACVVYANFMTYSGTKMTVDHFFVFIITPVLTKLKAFDLECCKENIAENVVTEPRMTEISQKCNDDDCRKQTDSESANLALVPQNSENNFCFHEVRYQNVHIHELLKSDLDFRNDSNMEIKRFFFIDVKNCDNFFSDVYIINIKNKIVNDVKNENNSHDDMFLKSDFKEHGDNVTCLKSVTEENGDGCVTDQKLNKNGSTKTSDSVLASDTNVNIGCSVYYLTSVTNESNEHHAKKPKVDTNVCNEVHALNLESDLNENNELHATFLESGTDENDELPAINSGSDMNESHELHAMNSESVISESHELPAMNSNDNNGTKYSRSVVSMDSNGSFDTVVPSLDDSTTYNSAGPAESAETRHEVSTCDIKIPQCSVVMESQLAPTSCKTEEEDNERSSFKDAIRRSTTPLEPFPRTHGNITAYPALNPGEKEDTNELRVQRDRATNMARNSNVVDSATGASDPNITVDCPSSSSMHHSWSTPSLPANGGKSCQNMRVPLATVASKPSTDDGKPSTDDSITATSGGITATDGPDLASAVLVQQSSTGSTLLNNGINPSGAYGFESHGQQTSIAGTKESLDGNVQQTNIAQPTSDQPTDSTPSTQSTEPRNRFEPLSAIIHKLSIGVDIPPQETMRYEMLRLYTLHSYPRENKPYIIRLAQAGFYYANNGDEVVCYCCGKRRNYWEETDNPMAVHQRLNPRCSFLVRNDEVNVKIHAADTNGHVSQENERTSCVTSITSLNESNNNTFSPERLNSGNVEISSNNSVTTPGENDTESVSSITRTRDVPSRSHGGFVMQTPETRPTAELARPQTADPAPAASSPSATGNGTSNTQRKKKVKFPNYVDASKRRETFDGCEIVIPIPSLVAAGLFYTGYGDCCRCHDCGIGLRHWSVDDDPWVEHARWSKECEFVRSKKGQEFIDLVHMALRISQNENGSSSNGDVNNGTANQTSSEIDSLLHGNAAQSLLEMGYSTDIIRQALRAVIDDQGRSAITAVTLTEKVFEIENQGSQSSTASSNVEDTVAKSQDGSGKTGATSRAHKKSQILEKKRLVKENARLKEQSICTICKKNSVCIVFLPCGHLVTCETCAPTVKYCNLQECGKYIKGTVRTYLA